MLRALAHHLETENATNYLLEAVVSLDVLYNGI
jgi:hypothetical protein